MAAHYIYGGFAAIAILKKWFMLEGNVFGFIYYDVQINFFRIGKLF